MTSFILPEEPAGPVWDRDGKEWTTTGDGRWAGPHITVSWSRLLTILGPLTDTPPVTVGDRITLAQLATLPYGSIAADSRRAYAARYGGVFETGLFGDITARYDPDLELTLLRIGDGRTP